MHIELIHTPGCRSYKKVLEDLETIIAEERLPLPVNVIALKAKHKKLKSDPTIRIDGYDLSTEVHGKGCNGKDNDMPCTEGIRDVLWLKWKELTEAPLLIG